MAAYYNENDEFAAAWLRELIRAGHIADGHVDTRSIEDVRPDDLRGFTQHHFFAGIGIWSHALRAAGWPDERPVWTGSCPCQPFSAAGKRGGAADKRHLWPDWFRLIRECGPATVFGEQVEGAVRLGWLDLVFGDLEAEGYACGAAVFGAHSVGAPHIRQRLYWVADATGGRPAQGRGLDGEHGGARDGLADDRADGQLADADDSRSQGRPVRGDGPNERAAGADGVAGRLADADAPGCGVIGGGGLLDGERPALEDDLDGRGAVRGLADHSIDGRREERPDARWLSPGDRAQGRSAGFGAGEPDRWSTATAGFWRDPDWLACRDGKWRPVESGTFPLVDGAPARVGRLRGYGNGLVAPQAAAFIRASIEAMRAA